MQEFSFLVGDAATDFHDQVIAVVVDHILDAAHEGRIEWVGNIGNDAADRQGLVGAQAAGGAVGNIAQLVHGGEHVWMVSSGTDTAVLALST